MKLFLSFKGVLWVPASPSSTTLLEGSRRSKQNLDRVFVRMTPIEASRTSTNEVPQDSR